jgi:hypothetical protein
VVQVLGNPLRRVRIEIESQDADEKDKKSEEDAERMTLLGNQYFTQFFGKRLAGEGFLEKMNAFIQNAVMGDDI